MTRSYQLTTTGAAGVLLQKISCSMLNAKGTPTQLQLRTMHGKSVSDSRIVRDLTVTDLQGENAIALPKTYSRDEIPVTPDQIPRPDSVHRWKNLQNVADYIPECMPNLQIGLLIGLNCPAALEPQEVAPRRETGPYATRLRHSWAIYGPLKIHSSSPSCVSSSRILVQEVEQCNDILTSDSALRILERDFHTDQPTFPGERGMSVEDERFLDIMQKGTTFCDDHYMLPLPFRDENVRLPNNINRKYPEEL